MEPVSAPPLPDSIAASSLDAAARRDLRGLAKDVAESVARHLVAAGVLLDEDPELALAHARYARRRASRIAVVREAAGIAAYHAGEWTEALADLRAARRMGGAGHLPVMADIERALGRPERAIDVARGPEVAELGRPAQIELAIVAAGARRDLGELDAAVVGLQIPELDPARRDEWSPRLFYAYADNLLAAGRESDAVQWFVHAADADTDGETDAAIRLAELTGEALPDDDVIEFGVEDELEDDEPAEAGTGEAAQVTGVRDAGSPATDDDAAATDATAVLDDPTVDDPRADDDASVDGGRLAGNADAPEDIETASVPASGHESVPAESRAGEPVIAEPVVTEPGSDEPSTDEPGIDESAGAVNAGPAAGEAGTEGPVAAEPIDDGTTDAITIDAESVSHEVGDHEAAAAESVEDKPGDDGPAADEETTRP